MKRLYVSVGAALIGFGLMSGCTKRTGQYTVLKQVAEQVAKGEAIVVDVREAEELSSGMAAPAIWMPISKINAEAVEWKRLVDENRQKTIAVYCAVGARAELVVRQLNEKGIKAVNLGGFSDWQAAKLPTKAGPPLGKP